MTEKNAKYLLGILITVFFIFGCVVYFLISRREMANSTEFTHVEEPFPVENFEITDTQGNTIQLSDFQGEVVIINFWASWSDSCKRQMEELNNFYNETKDSDEVELLMINLTDGLNETKESVDKFMVETGYDFPVYLDYSLLVCSYFNIMHVPTTVVIDQEGNLYAYKASATTEDELFVILEELGVEF